LAEIRLGNAEVAGIGTGVGTPHFLAVLAEVLRKAGYYDHALRALGQCARAQEQGQRYWDAELQRLRAAILIEKNSEAVEEAETLFVESLEIARRQKAKAFELRAAIGLARLWQRQGTRDANKSQTWVRAVVLAS